MSSILYIGGMLVIWVVNLLNGTGIGMAYRTTDLAMAATFVIMVAFFCYQVMQEGDINVPRKYFYTIFTLGLVFIGVTFANNQRLDMLEGFWVYMIIYILSRVKISMNAQRVTSICYGVLGLAILFIFNYMDALDGWNANSIAMIGLFSFVIFTIPFYGMTDWRSFVVLPLVGAAYAFLIWPTDSRSCIVVVIVMLLFVLRVIPVNKLLRSSKALFVMMLVPLFVAILICLISAFGDISGLAELNKDVFGKDLFNGRDKIWMDGFQNLWRRPLFGSGQIISGYWHNSALACLTAFGVIGYFLWIKLFHLILKEGCSFLNDVCVVGSMVGFLAIYCHQSVELGIFESSPSLLPYVVLGIILGRVNYLKGERV